MLPFAKQGCVRLMPARLLFIAGCPRSGTSALGRYLNLHPEILVCIERYKYVPPEKIKPHLFTFERILDYREGETNIRRERHVELLSGRDPAQLKWIGDKKPAYYRQLRTIMTNNPGARFIIIHRPVEEVAESFQGRARDPEDHWPEWAGFEAGVERWNQAINYVREFMESGRQPEVLILEHHEFFGRPESYTSLLSEFLEVEFDESLRETWREISSSYEDHRRPKEPPSEEQQDFVRENKDYEAERWILDVIEQQRHGPVKFPRSDRVGRRVHEDQLKDLEGRLRRERRKSRQLRQRNKRLEREAQIPNGSAPSISQRLVRLKDKLFGKRQS